MATLPNAAQTAVSDAYRYDPFGVNLDTQGTSVNRSASGPPARANQRQIRLRRPPKAEVVQPQGGVAARHSTSPMSADALIEHLLAIGCHQTDIGDAFYEADPEWVTRPDSEEGLGQ
ncbi:MAG TPA: hypothetical protein VF178_16960 [Gemmatimonadaceae bacterium]